MVRYKAAKFDEETQKSLGEYTGELFFICKSKNMFIFIEDESNTDDQKKDLHQL